MTDATERDLVALLADSPHDHLLIRPATNRGGRSAAHLPSPDDGDRPQCGKHIHRDGSSYRRRRPGFLPSSVQLCRMCDPDVELPRENTGPTLAAKLSKLDPDAVGSDREGSA